MKSKAIDKHTGSNNNNNNNNLCIDNATELLNSKDFEHKLHQSTPVNTTTNERIAPFNVAVSVATKQHTFNSFLNDSVDDKSSGSNSKAQSNSHSHMGENKKIKSLAQVKIVNQHSNTDINDKVSK